MLVIVEKVTSKNEEGNDEVITGRKAAKGIERNIEDLLLRLPIICIMRRSLIATLNFSRAAHCSGEVQGMSDI